MDGKMIISFDVCPSDKTGQNYAHALLEHSDTCHPQVRLYFRTIPMLYCCGEYYGPIGSPTEDTRKAAWKALYRAPLKIVRVAHESLNNFITRIDVSFGGDDNAET